MASRHKQERAAIAKDLKAAEATLKASLAPDFKYVQDGKTQDAKTFTQGFMETLKMMDKVTTSSTKYLSLKESGAKGYGSVKLHMVGTMKSSGKKAHKINWTGYFTEEYSKVGGKWKTSKMVAGKQIFLMDGKRVKM